MTGTVEILKAVRSGVIGLGVLAFACTPMLAAYYWDAPRVDWVATAQRQAETLLPCYYDPAITRLEALAMRGDQLAREAGHAYDDDTFDRFPGGPFEGIIIPKRCFAVSVGYYGFTVALYQRPRLPGGGWDMTIPVWTPTEHQIGLEKDDAK